MGDKNMNDEGTVIVVSYRSIDDASGEAIQVAKKLEKYSDNLKNQIYNKLDRYSGEHTSNINNAKRFISNKISDLDNKARSFRTYSSNLDFMHDECQKTDRAVRSNVSRLTADFKAEHNIKNNVVVNTLNYFLTSVGNSTGVGRWLNNANDKVKMFKDDAKKAIKVWWEYEGGKEFTVGVLKGVGELALAVAAVAGAIVTGGGLIFVIAGVVGGVIAGINAIANIANEFRAYSSTLNQDPATGRRRSAMDTVQDTIRAETSNKGLHAFATGLDITEFVCNVIDIAGSAKEFLQKGYKWVNNLDPKVKLDDIKRKDYLTKDNVKGMYKKFKTTIGKYIPDDVKKAFKNKDIGWANVKGLAKKYGSELKNIDWADIKVLAKQYGSDFMNSLGNGFEESYLDFEFDASKKMESIKNISTSFGNWYKLESNILAGDFGELASDFRDFAFEKITFDNENIIMQLSTDEKIKEKYEDNITLDSITGIFGDVGDLTKDTFEKIKDVLSKLSFVNKVNISIPDNLIPVI